MVVPWSAVFDNAAPVEVEIGPGRGEVLVALASAAPAVNFFAIEHSAGRVEAIRRKVAARGLGNVRVVAGDARCIVARLVPAASVTAYHVYVPDPWPKNRHHRRRLAGFAFAAAVARTLVPGGAAHVATDLPVVLDDFVLHLVGAGLRLVRGAPAPPRPTTSFERRYALAGTYYVRFDRAG